MADHGTSHQPQLSGWRDLRAGNHDVENVRRETARVDRKAISAGARTYGERQRSGASGFALEWDGRELPLRQGDNVIGRTGARAAIVIADPHVSATHARIVIAGDSATIEDLDSKNHTMVGATRITDAHPLEAGDVIRLGGPSVIFRRATVKTVTARTRRTSK